jgi:FKBP-type peptidyl-prolyl cis-trans isomerase FkpA
MRKVIIVALLITMFAAPACAADRAKTEEEKTLYAVGLIMSRQLNVFNLTPAELEIVKQGFEDARSGRKTEVDIEAYRLKAQELAKARRKAQGEKLAAANLDFLERAAKEKGAQKSSSGLIYRSLSEGTGNSPGPSDTVKVNYRSSFPDGEEFDSSAARGKPLEAKMDDVMKCLKEGLPKMKTGGKAQLICPPELAYGEVGAGDLIPPGATLVFEVELLDVKQ